MTQQLRIRYRFDLPDGSKRHVDLNFAAADFRLSNPTPIDPPTTHRVEADEVEVVPDKKA